MGTKPAQNVHFTKIRNGFHQQIPRASVRLQYLPSPDFIDFAPQLSLITNDGSPLTLAVAEKLQQAGNQVVILNLPFVNNFTLPANFKTINLESANDLGAKQAIEKLASFGKIGNFIHLNPHFANNKDLGQHFETETNLLKTVFFLAKHLSKPLNELGKISRTNFLTISRIDGNLGLKNANSSVFAGGLSGIVKCINIEWQSVFCRAIDIDPKNAVSQASAQIFAELHDSNLQTIEVAYQGNLRQTLVAKREILQENVEKISKITKNSVFLVSGGAKGVTADCVLKMAEVYQCKFILLGRSSNDFAEPIWAKGITAEADLKKLAMQDLIGKGEKPTPILVQKAVNQIVAKREIDESLQSIRNFGSQVEYLAVDVLNADSIKKMLPKAVQNLGNITGIIHGAGRLADKLIDNKSDADFDAVYTVKVKGLLNLLDCVDIKEMQQIVLFSSVAGFFGNTGQTDYSMANEILSKSAHFLKNHYPNLHISAINWGAWDSGMVTPELKKMFAHYNILLIPNEAGAWLMVNELTSEYESEPQTVIGMGMPLAQSYLGELKTHQIHRKMTLAENPFLNDHVIGGNAVLPVVNSVAWIAHACEQLYPDFKISKVEDTKLLKGIVFDGTQAENYTLVLKELEKNSETILFDCKLSSLQNGKLRFHYATQVRLQKNISEAPTLPIPTEKMIADGKELYKNGALFHGKSFQGIEKVLKLNEHEILLECQSPEIDLATQGQFPVERVNPYLTDIQYQGLVVWVRHQYQCASLPIKTKTATIYAPIPFGERFYVNVKITQHTDFKAVANIFVWDSKGKVLMQTEDAEVAVSKALQW